MFVNRCYFYIENKQIVRKDFEIEWTENINKEFRDRLVYAIENVIPGKLLPAADVTNSSQYRDIRDLNIFNVQSEKKGMNLYRYWNDIIMSVCDDADNIPGVFSYMYISRLSYSDIETILRYNCYYDIYFNPSKKVNSLALTFIALKLLIQQNKMDYLKDASKFMYWYLCNVGTMKIIRNREEEE